MKLLASGFTDAYCENEAAVYMAGYLNEIDGIAAAFLAEYPEADRDASVREVAMKAT